MSFFKKWFSLTINHCPLHQHSFSFSANSLFYTQKKSILVLIAGKNRRVLWAGLLMLFFFIVALWWGVIYVFTWFEPLVFWSACWLHSAGRFSCGLDHKMCVCFPLWIYIRFLHPYLFLKYSSIVIIFKIVSFLSRPQWQQFSRLCKNWMRTRV